MEETKKTGLYDWFRRDRGAIAHAGYGAGIETGQQKFLKGMW